EIPIEERSGREITHVLGRSEKGEVVTVELTAPGSPARNPAFDVTPARLVTGLITERGTCPADREGLKKLFPERAEVKGAAVRRRVAKVLHKRLVTPVSSSGLRAEIVSVAQRMSTSGLSPGRSGNVSVRVEGGMLITATGMHYSEMRPSDIVEVRMD